MIIAKDAIDSSLKKTMKRSLTLLVILLISLSSKSQGYIPMLDGASEWHLTSCFSGCLTDVYYINSDTTVQGVNYKILDGFHYISRSFLFREEPANQRVFLSYPDGAKGNQEVLLYDFSLSVGDSFTMKNPITPFPAEGGSFRLDSIIPRQLSDGLNHRFYYFSPTVNNSNIQFPIWVEGIGSLSLINAPGGTPDVLGAGKISCHFKNGNLIYSQLDSISACSPINISLPETAESRLKIYPTLVKNKLHIEGNTAFNRLQIYNSQGQIVLTEVQFNTKQTHTLSTSHLPPGFYVLYLEKANHRTQSFKFYKL
tara:strand:- start:1133 stop:2068 length:936 start_codon:yes stop_codon:yes gene_type:complete